MGGDLMDKYGIAFKYGSDSFITINQIHEKPLVSVIDDRDEAIRYFKFYRDECGIHGCVLFNLDYRTEVDWRYVFAHKIDV